MKSTMFPRIFGLAAIALCAALSFAISGSEADAAAPVKSLPSAMTTNLSLFDVQAIPQPMPARHGRGHKMPSKEVSARRHRVSNAKHGATLAALPVATQAVQDSRTTGLCTSVWNQKQCGDCYNWSGCKSASVAQLLAGVVKPIPGSESAFLISPQFILDYHPELGGCNGGDEYQVDQAIQSGGAPSVVDYGGDGASDGQRPKPTSGMTLYTIASIVYVDQTQNSQGVASTQSIKNAILAYGSVSVAVDASRWTDGSSTINWSGHNIDHAVTIIGWDDTHDNGDGSKGAWVMQNQWDTSWGVTCANAAYPNPSSGGYAWVKYGACDIGTEAYVCVATAPAPPSPAPTPIPPVPVPPTPAPATVITIPSGSYTITGNADGTITLTPSTSKPASGIFGTPPTYNVTGNVGSTAVNLTASPAGISSSKGAVNYLEALIDAFDLFEAIKATGNANLIADLKAKNYSQLAIDLMAIGTDPTVLQDLYNLADALGVAMPPLADKFKGKIKLKSGKLVGLAPLSEFALAC